MTDSLQLTRRLEARLSRSERLSSHPAWPLLGVILGGETSVSTAGFPYLSDASFRLFKDRVPHLFRDGLELLRWLGALSERLGTMEDVSAQGRTSMERAIRVLRTMVFTASVTAPPDLWVLRLVLAAHRRSGVLQQFGAGDSVTTADLAARLDLEPRQLEIDLCLLHARGYLERWDSGYVLADRAAVAAVPWRLGPLPGNGRVDWVPLVADLVSSEGRAEMRELEEFLKPQWADTTTGTWIASAEQIELGFRLLPIVLALRVTERTRGLTRGARLEDTIGGAGAHLEPLLAAAGLVEVGAVTELGARVFARGPGPFGIIAAYHPYFSEIDALLRVGGKQVWVRRGQNVAASQDANRKTFEAANDALDRFCSDWEYSFSVFIEHAVGQGEAVRQRYERDGEARVRYFGADLEDAAIDQAEVQQRLGRLPSNMEFIRRADIGEPQKVVDYLESRGVPTEGAVMMVGNGFHEIRDQNREKMTGVFAGYERAGVVILLTEENSLADRDLIATGWNTYHAGFRYVHEVSGQGLRPSAGEGHGGRWSWRRCATAGGYMVLDDYGYRSRTIYPFRRPDGRNPAISMSYFCVPRRLAERLGLTAPSA